MKILSRFLGCVLFTYFTATVCFSQKEKITGRWKPVRIVMDKQPGGMDIEWAEKTMFEAIKKRADSTGREMSLDDGDSAEVKQTAKKILDEIFQNIYFRFNPDNSCYWNFGNLVEGTAYEGVNVKAKYKVKKKAMSITFTNDKTQTISGAQKKTYSDKLTFYYSFKNDQLRLEMDDGSMIFYLIKSE
jgi:hypothetical protein